MLNPDLFEGTGTKIHSITKGAGDTLFAGGVNGSFPGFYRLDEQGVAETFLQGRDIDLVKGLDNGNVLSVSDGQIYLYSEQGLDLVSSIAWAQNATYYCAVQSSATVVIICVDGFGLAKLDIETGDVRQVRGTFGKHVRSVELIGPGKLLVASNKGLFLFNEDNGLSFPIGSEYGMKDSDFEFRASIALNDTFAMIAGDEFNYLLNIPDLMSYVNNRANHVSSVQFPWYTASQPGETPPLAERPDGEPKNLLTQDGHIEIQEGFSTLKIFYTTAGNNINEALGYEYRVRGIADSWLKAAKAQQSVALTTLPAGQYELQVRVLDDKSSQPQPTSGLKILVTPPFYKTWQAYLAYGFLVVLSWFAFHHYRTRILLDNNRKLERFVDERTQALALSNRKVSDMLDQKGALFSHISHELRTPLTLIEGPLEELKKQADNADSYRLTQLMTRNVARLNQLVDELLELAKLDTPGLLIRQNYHVATVLQQIERTFQPLIRQQNKQLFVEVNYEGYVLLTKDSLEKIVSNLLLNAIKYTPSGGIIRIHCSDNGNRELVITVSDNGSGIEPDLLPTIFQRFTRANSDHDAPGVGLGLSIVKELSQFNKGDVSVSSELGKGTAFTVTLPIIEQQQIPSDIVTAGDDISCQMGQGNNARNIEEKCEVLLVDDSDDMLQFLEHVLSDRFFCVSAKNGIEGLQRAKERIPDIVITDVMMPYCDGVSLLHEIRRDEKTSHIPVLVITARGDDDTRLVSFRSNADDYLEKPFNGQEMVIRVERLLSIRSILSKKNGGIVSAVSPSSSEMDLTCLDLVFTHPNDEKFYHKFVRIIEQHYASPDLNRTKAAQLMAVSERQLNRKLSALIEYNFSQYLRKYRLHKAKSLLERGTQVTEVSYDVGFSSPSYFSNCFRAEFDLSPKEYADRMLKAIRS